VAKASLRHLPIRFSELANTPHSPLANAFAIRFSEWQSLWRMHRIRQTKATTGENKIKTVLCVTWIPGLHLPHQQAEACHALPLLLINDGLGSKIGLNINLK